MRNRRAFLADASVLAAVVLAPGPALLAESFGLQHHAASLNDMACVDFERCVGNSFVVREGTTTVAILKLIEVRPQPASPTQWNTADAAHEKFSLIFQGSPEMTLSQNTYQFVRDGVGHFDMFIAPLTLADPTASWYEAIFNRARTRRSPKL
jgi:hypothetical protein